MPNHAVIVGINHYPGITTLKGPCADAEAFREWVEKPGPGGVAEENVHMILSSDFVQPDDPSGARPFDAEIKATLRGLLPNGPEHVGDRLYMFVAGHGASDLNLMDSAGLIAANAEQVGIDFPVVIMTDYFNYFRRVYAFKEIILLMDCCLDATVTRPLERSSFLQVPAHSKAASVKRFLGNATLWNKKSYEKQINGEVRGIFSVALMDALYNAPSPTDAVTGKVVEDYVKNNIKTIAGEVDIEPPRFSGEHYRDIVFHRRDDPNQGKFRLRITAFGAADGSVVELYDGGRNLIDSQSIQNEEATFRVIPGIYKAGLVGTDRVFLDEVVADHEVRI